jgi:hypothetical protein
MDEGLAVRAQAGLHDVVTVSDSYPTRPTPAVLPQGRRLAPPRVRRLDRRLGCVRPAVRRGSRVTRAGPSSDDDPHRPDQPLTTGGSKQLSHPPSQQTGGGP